MSSDYNSFRDNKVPNRLAPKVPESILNNSLLYSFVSFSIVAVIPFSNSPEF